jgi:phospholipase C
VPTATATLTPRPTATITWTPTVTATATPKPPVPNFDHIVVLIFENKEFGTVIDNPDMPTFNQLANDYSLLTQFYAVTHPSLPNYIAMIGGDTFGITSNCQNCFVNAPSLPDLIEASGRTWKTYQEDLPEPCFIGNTKDYAQKHNPFIYFDPIRLNVARCQSSVVPLTALQTDIAASTLPNFIYITPNLCNSAHDCSLDVTDKWLNNILTELVPALDQQSSNYLIVLTWDEGQGNHSCCGLPPEAGGRIAVVLVSPEVKRQFQDPTPYTHYSLLKTIAKAWGLPYLGHAAEDNHPLILAPFE